MSLGSTRPASAVWEDAVVRAAVAKRTTIEVRDDVPDPVPGPGQVLVRTIACGICGSDLHALDHPEEMEKMIAALGAPGALGPEDGYVPGHEFVAEVLEHGPQTEGTVPVGGTVCALPFAVGASGLEPIGYSRAFPGGFGERMVLQEAALVPVPERLDTHTAALTEPLAVGEHAVALADVRPGWPCHVVGCGPIGLMIILALKARGMSPIFASDFSAARRALAVRLGADVVLDPGVGTGFPDFAELGIPTNPLQRAVAAGSGLEPPRAVIFEAVGTPGVIDAIVNTAPPASRVLVAGVCMQTDHIELAVALTKELELRFAFGYTGPEFAATLGRIAAAPEVVTPLVTSTVGMEDIDGAIDALRAGEQVKVLVRH